MASVDTSNFIPELWASEALGQLFQRSELLALVNKDYNAELKARGDIVNIQKAGTLTTQEFTTAVVVQTPSETNIPLTLDHHFDITFAIKDTTQSMANADVIKLYTGEAMQTLAETIDAEIMKTYALASDSVGTLGAGVTDANMLALRTLFQANKVSKINRYVVVSAAGYSNLVDLDKFVDADKIGDGLAIKSGRLGQIYGMSVYENEDVASLSGGSIGISFQRNSITAATRTLEQINDSGVSSAVVTQDGIGIRVIRSYNTSAKRYQISCDLLWGLAVTEDKGLFQVKY